MSWYYLRHVRHGTVVLLCPGMWDYLGQSLYMQDIWDSLYGHTKKAGTDEAMGHTNAYKEP